MKKLPIKTVVENLLELQKTGDSATLLGIGPMSKNCVQATLELSKEDDFTFENHKERNAGSDGSGFVRFKKRAAADALAGR